MDHLWLLIDYTVLDSCDHENAMKIFLVIVALVVVVASVFADYKWRQWMAARRRERQ
jgi:hypothetical protein